MANGLDPSSPGYQSYVLTGKMPREDAQPLTATDKKAIIEADEGVLAARTAVDNLTKAKNLSRQAFAGPMASGRGYAASFLGGSSDLGKGGIATTDLNNLVTTNALTQLKAIFGGNPTEGERAILLDIQGSANQPDEVRQKIYDRAALRLPTGASPSPANVPTNFGAAHTRAARQYVARSSATNTRHHTATIRGAAIGICVHGS